MLSLISRPAYSDIATTELEDNFGDVVADATKIRNR